MSIERRFNISLIAEMALREKQIQQNYRPFIGVHKWFARRPGTLFRGLILAEFGKGRLEDIFYESNELSGIRIADPFMGGGTPLIEANRVGCDVQGVDINPMSAWIVREEIECLDISAYERAVRTLMGDLRASIGQYYRTSCPLYGDADVPVKSFLWVKVLDCEACGRPLDLFPGYLLANNRRHPKNVLVCPACGDLNEVEDCKFPNDCATCGTALCHAGPARRGHCSCPRCGHSNVYPGKIRRPLEHRLFAIEYHNPKRKAEHKGRFFKKPDAEDIARMADATKRWKQHTPRFVPGQEIPPGDETNRLHRWGYARNGSRNVKIPIDGEWIGEKPNGVAVMWITDLVLPRSGELRRTGFCDALRSYRAVRGPSAGRCFFFDGQRWAGRCGRKSLV